MAVPTDWAHVAGRGHIIAEPYASSPELTGALCRRCHSAIDEHRDQQRIIKFQSQGAMRLIARWNAYSEDKFVPEAGVEWLVVVRQVVRLMESDLGFII